jgi:hypothetical protein
MLVVAAYFRPSRALNCVIKPCTCSPETQLKHAKVARQLEAATTAEQAATERCEELQEELQDVSMTCRNRMRWLEQAMSDAARRTQRLHSCLLNTAPLEVRLRWGWLEPARACVDGAGGECASHANP